MTIDQRSLTMAELNEKAVEAARAEIQHSFECFSWERGVPTSAVQAAIRAYLAALPASDHPFPSHRFDGAMEVPSYTSNSSAPAHEHAGMPRLQTIRAHKHTCANVQPGSTFDDKCDCGALDTAGNAIEVSSREAATALSAGVRVRLDPTEEMIAAGLRVDLSNEDERAAVINLWHAMAALSDAVVVTEEATRPVRAEIKSEREILERLAAGDEIAFSQDGDDAFFVGGDRAFVGEAIISMRSKGYLKRIVVDEENYRGMSEHDVISDAARSALEASE